MTTTIRDFQSRILKGHYDLNIKVFNNTSYNKIQWTFVQMHLFLHTKDTCSRMVLDVFQKWAMPGTSLLHKMEASSSIVVRI